MRIPDLKVDHKTDSGKSETIITFSFHPPQFIQDQIELLGFKYSAKTRNWKIPELIDEHTIISALSTWPGGCF